MTSTPAADDPYADVPHTADLAAGDHQTAERADDDAPLNVPSPPTLPDGALSGTAGEIVRALAPHTEADPAALLATLLSFFGAMVGNGPHVLRGNDEHPARLWPLIVGRTSGGAKGTSLSVIRALMRSVDPTFSENVLRGLTSGEGLIESVRDAGDQTDPDAPDFDEGVLDKRRLFTEDEYGSVLNRSRREGSSLPHVMRSAWDGVPLQTLARKQNALTATDHHIAVIGHISPTEFLRSLRATDLAGGTVNRHLLIYSQRARLLPGGGNVPQQVIDQLAPLVADALANVGHLQRQSFVMEPAAETYWSSLYAELCRPVGDDPVSAATGRAAAQVIRLALTFALLDADNTIRLDHLTAAASLWFYCEETARWLFTTAENETAQRDHDKVLDFIATAGPAGVTRSDLRERLFQRNKSRAALDAILEPLIRAGHITQTTEPTAGRARTVYTIPTRKG